MGVITGTAGNDSLNGTDGPDAIDGSSAGDWIDGAGGDDRINGRAGDDILRGGSGRDWLTGAGGDDVIDGGAGFDEIQGDGDFNFDVVTDTIGPDGGAPDGDIGTTGNFRGANAVEVRVSVPDLGPPGPVSLVLFATGVDSGEEVEVLLNGVLLGLLNAAPLAGGRSATLFQVDPGLLDPGGSNIVVARHTDAAGSEGWQMRLDKVSLTVGTSGNDWLSASGEGFRDSIRGGPGDDHLLYGGVMIGGDGNDRLTSGPDSAFLYGGAGNDLIEGGGPWLYGDDAVGGGSIQFIDPASMPAGHSLEHFFAFETVWGTPESASLRVRARDTDALAAGDPQQVELWFNGHRLGLLKPVPEGGSAETVFAFDPSWIVSGDDNLVQIVNLGGTGPAIERFEVQFHTAQGDDEIQGDDQHQFAYGGGGADLINGRGGDDRLYGEVGADALYGGDGADLIEGGEGDDLLDGGSGADSLAGGGGDDIYFVDDAGDTVTEAPGGGTDEVRTSLASYSLLGSQVEKLAASSNVAHDFRGGGGDNAVTGGEGNDFLRLQDGGADSGLGGGGNDVFLFGAALTSADTIDGGTGTDQIAIQGDYAGAEALTLGSNVVSVENVAILPGSDTRFGDPGTNFYSYEITAQDIALASGVQLVVDANRLRPGEDLTFNGSAESDGSFFIYGGSGTDLLTGGSRNDVFIFGHQGQWGTGDIVTGGAGVDQLALRGNYTITFGANQLVGIEQIGMVSAQDTRYGALGSSYNYDLTMVDANVDSIQMTVDAAPLRPGETLTFDGSAEDDGSFRLFGGRGDDTIIGSQNGDILAGNGGADILTGGAGGDAFRYVATLDSNSEGFDQILDFTPGTDWIDLSRIDADVHSAGNQAFRWIGDNAFSRNGPASAGELSVWQNWSGSWIVEGDTDGDGVADFVLEVMLVGSTPLGPGDFLP
ncbi:MAG TPA: M10 family metallopeptidase C-terminal domain-containing protein [Allosphingosinicella sp.]